MNRLNEVLEEKGLTQKDLSDMTGLSTSMICRIAQGKRDGNFMRWAMIAHALGVHMEELMEDVRE